MTATAIPCPFCGNDDPCIDEVEIHIHAVVCDDCGCIGPIERYNEGTTQTAERAIDLWNQRAKVTQKNEVKPDSWQERAARGAL